MPGDPIECRQHARRCAELASTATTREQFLSLQQSWMRLAADLDNAKAFINALEEMDADPPIKAAE
jgi:hypothetical protein